MLNQPFHKLTLKFHSLKFEALYEKQQNQIRSLTFTIMSFFVGLGFLACLIILIINSQSNDMIIVYSLATVVSLFLTLLSKKLQPYMKEVFSIMFIFATITQVYIYYSEIKIPHFVFGYSAGCLSQGVIQYSDNRLKIIYILITPTVFLAVFDAFDISMFQFLILAYASMIFLGAMAYMNEHTSRVAFWLNQISIQQRQISSYLREILKEFVKDSLLLISMNDRTQQFCLEMANKQCESQFNIKESESLRIFLRACHLITQLSMKAPDLKKKQTFEEILFAKFQQGCLNALFTEIGYLDQKISIEMKILDFGTPMILLIIKSNKQLSDNRIERYRQLIINYSQQLAEMQINVQKEIKTIKPHVGDLLQCLSVQIMNRIRNFIIYFNRDQLQNQIDSLHSYQLFGFLQVLENFFCTIANHKNKRFKLINSIGQDFYIRLNTKFLTQILINVFDIIVQQSLIEEIIQLQVSEESSLNPLKDRYTFLRSESFKKKEETPQISTQRLISFCFIYTTDALKEQRSPQSQNLPKNNEILDIQEQVTRLLIGILGPYNNSNQITPIIIGESSFRFANKIQFYIYSDQSILEASFMKSIKKEQSQI